MGKIGKGHQDGNYLLSINNGPWSLGQTTRESLMEHPISHKVRRLAHSTMDFGMAPFVSFIYTLRSSVLDLRFDISNSDIRALWIDFRNVLFVYIPFSSTILRHYDIYA